MHTGRPADWRPRRVPASQLGPAQQLQAAASDYRPYGSGYNARFHHLCHRGAPHYRPGADGVWLTFSR